VYEVFKPNSLYQEPSYQVFKQTLDVYLVPGEIKITNTGPHCPLDGRQ